ncbi:MAG: permease [Spirochaetes bacterium]|nr:permease [Spirochaetota bacterium]
MIITILLITITFVLILISWFKSKNKTKESLKNSKTMFLSIFKEIIGILALVGLSLVLIPEKTITQLLGGTHEWLSVLFGAILGTITIIPGVIAFPLAKELLAKGAILTALASFITTLTMVGFATAPIEIKQFGKSFTLYRNLLSFCFAIVIALLMGVLL